MSEKLELLESVTFTEDTSLSQQQQQHNIDISIEEISITNATNISMEDVVESGRGGGGVGVGGYGGGNQDTERDQDLSELPVDTPRTEDTFALNLHSNRSMGSLVRGVSEDRVGASLETGRGGGVGGGAAKGLRGALLKKNSHQSMEIITGREAGGSKSLSPKKSFDRDASRPNLRGSGGEVDGGSGRGGGGRGGASTRTTDPLTASPSFRRPAKVSSANETLIQVGEILASLLPLQVYPEGGGRAARAPTLQECSIIVRHLKQVGDDRADELRKLKVDLRDLLDSNKWSPDAFLLARAYVADLTAAEQLQQQQQHQTTSLPRIELRQRTKRVPSDAYVPVKEEMTLPALSQIMPGNKNSERKKRTQILQKARLHQKVPEATGL